MGCCCAPNCSSRREKGIKLFRFPKDPERRRRWVKNCRRDKWTPTSHSELCEVHFDESQFEQHRQDGRKLLKMNAIPTLFSGSNCSKRSWTRTVVCEQGNVVTRSTEPVDYAINEQLQMTLTLLNEIKALKKENRTLKAEIENNRLKKEEYDSNLQRFLRPDQLAFLQTPIGQSTNPHPWSEATIAKALQIRTIVGQKGYEFLRKEQNYPLPSSRTLCRHVQSTQFDTTTQNKANDMLHVNLQPDQVSDHFTLNESNKQTNQ